MQNPFSDSFRFNNPVLDFLKEIYPQYCLQLRVMLESFQMQMTLISEYDIPSHQPPFQASSSPIPRI